MPKREVGVKRPHFMTFIRQQGFQYRSGRAGRNDLWRHPDGRTIILPRTKRLPDEWVRTTLIQNRFSDEAIEEFMRHAKA